MNDFQDLITQRLAARIEADAMSAASVRIERRGDLLLDWTGGCLDFGPDAPPATSDSVFLIASITKPMTCCGVATLIERGLIDLDDPVAQYVPEFAANGKEGVLIRHCFTHTSGLPDMLPENEELRRANAPVEEFVASTCRTHLLFPPGTDLRYQSKGILMLAEIAERVTGTRFRDLLADEIFAPAGMESTHLGWRSDFEGRSVAAKVHAPGATAHWNHNSPYWRDFGAPWGGAHSTAADITRLLRVMLDGGTAQDGRTVLQPGSARLMLADHTAALSGLPAPARLREGYGLGWRIHRLGESGWYGGAVPAGAFGHAGATGTLAWADPASGVTFVLLTNGLLEPGEEGPTLRACSNITAAALCGPR